MSELSEIARERLKQRKCFSCGGTVTEKGNKFVCSFCGNEYKKIENEVVPIVEQIADLRISGRRFDEALDICAEKLKEQPDCLELYWQAILAEFGVIYVSEPDGKKFPTFFRVEYGVKRDIIQHSYYFLELKKRIGDDSDSNYLQQAKELDKILNQLGELVAKEESYDVFISFKQSVAATTTQGEDVMVNTEDSFKARELYDRLTKLKIKTFFSPVSIGQNKDAQGKVYEPRILRALQTSKVMILFGSQTEYLKATWVENEWRRYKFFINTGARKPESLIYLYKLNMPVLPGDLTRAAGGNIQLNSVDFFQSDYIDKVIELIKPFIKRGGLISAAKIERKQIKKTSRDVQSSELKGFVATKATDFGLDKNLKLIEGDIKADTNTGYRRGANALKKLKLTNPDSGKIAALELVIRFRVAELSKLQDVIFVPPAKPTKDYWTELYNKIKFIIDNADNEDFYKEFLGVMYDCIFKNINNPYAVELLNIVKNRKYVADGIDLRRDNIQKIKSQARAVLNYPLFISALDQLELSDDEYKREIKLYASKALSQSRYTSVLDLTNNLLKLDNSDVEVIDMKNLASLGYSDWGSFFKSENGYTTFGDGQMFKEALGFIDSDSGIDKYLDEKFIYIKQGLSVRTEKVFIAAVDKFLGLYRNETRRRTVISDIVNYCGDKKCFEAGIHYCELLITNSNDSYDAHIYWIMTLYSFGTDKEQDLYLSTEDIDKKSNYFNLAYQKADEQFSEQLVEIRTKQLNAAENNRKAISDRKRRSRNHIVGSVIKFIFKTAILIACLAAIVASVCTLFGVEKFCEFWEEFPIDFFTKPLSQYILFVGATVLLLIVLATMTSSDSVREFKPLPLLFTIFFLGVIVAAYYLEMSLLTLLCINVGEVVLFIIFFIAVKKMSPNFGFLIATSVINIIAVISVLVLGYLHIEELMPNLKAMSELVAEGAASQEYYDGILKEVKIVYIIGMIILGILVIAITIWAGVEGEKSDLAAPLAMIGSMCIFVLLLNLIVGGFMPESAEAQYSASSIILDLIGGILLCIPGTIYIMIVLGVSKAVDNA